MEIKPESVQAEDHRDFRYKLNNNISNKGKKIMNKKAYEHLVSLIINKQASDIVSPQNIPDPGTAWSQAMGGLRQAPGSSTTVNPLNNWYDRLVDKGKNRYNEHY